MFHMHPYPFHISNPMLYPSPHIKYIFCLIVLQFIISIQLLLRQIFFHDVYTMFGNLTEKYNYSQNRWVDCNEREVQMKEKMKEKMK